MTNEERRQVVSIVASQMYVKTTPEQYAKAIRMWFRMNPDKPVDYFLAKIGRPLLWLENFIRVPHSCD